MDFSLSKLRNFYLFWVTSDACGKFQWNSRSNQSIAAENSSLAIYWSVLLCLRPNSTLPCCRLIVSKWIKSGLFVLEFKIFVIDKPFRDCRLRTPCFWRLIIWSKLFNPFSLVIIGKVFAFRFVFLPIFIRWLERKLVLRLIVIRDTLSVFFLFFWI